MSIVLYSAQDMSYNHPMSTTTTQSKYEIRFSTPDIATAAADGIKVAVEIARRALAKHAYVTPAFSGEASVVELESGATLRRYHVGETGVVHCTYRMR